MNKIGQLLEELHEAETDLAHHYRIVAERQAAEHDVYHLCHVLAQQADLHAARIRNIASGSSTDLAEPGAERLTEALGVLRQKASHLLGRRPEAGMLLLRDLRELFLQAQAVNVHWIALGQVAQDVRDQQLLDEVSALHKQTLTQIKWLTTRIKQSVPQVLVTQD